MTSRQLGRRAFLCALPATGAALFATQPLAETPYTAGAPTPRLHLALRHSLASTAGPNAYAQPTQVADRHTQSRVAAPGPTFRRTCDGRLTGMLCNGARVHVHAESLPWACFAGTVTAYGLPQSKTVQTLWSYESASGLKRLFLHDDRAVLEHRCGATTARIQAPLDLLPGQDCYLGWRFRSNQELQLSVNGHTQCLVLQGMPPMRSAEQRTLCIGSYAGTQYATLPLSDFQLFHESS